VTAMKIAMMAGERQNLWIEAIQKRVAITAEMLGSMKGVKISGLTDLLFNKIQALREHEILASQKFRSLLIAVVGLCVFPSCSLAHLILRI
jgi:ATP-binding cassette subfamily C (CFTR/MRP) protein 1